jgi:transposase-like protein
MTRKKRYSAEFKREALRRANENGVTDTPKSSALARGSSGVGAMKLRRTAITPSQATATRATKK